MDSCDLVNPAASQGKRCGAQVLTCHSHVLGAGFNDCIANVVFSCSAKWICSRLLIFAHFCRCQCGTTVTRTSEKTCRSGWLSFSTGIHWTKYGYNTIKFAYSTSEVLLTNNHNPRWFLQCKEYTTNKWRLSDRDFNFCLKKLLIYWLKCLVQTEHAVTTGHIHNWHAESCTMWRPHDKDTRCKVFWDQIGSDHLYLPTTVSNN